MSLDGDLQDGDLPDLDDQRVVVVRFGAEKVWRLLPNDQAAALKLDWNAGNLNCHQMQKPHLIRDRRRTALPT